MKQYGFVGKGTGKLGASVFAISGGEQIVRQYNPVVSNPNTEAQIAQRAKLKLMSQLGAALAPALGFAKMGLVSARNQFVSRNIGLATFGEEKASVDLTGIQLTPSHTSFPALTSEPAGSGAVNVELKTAAAADIKRVVYAVYEKTEDSDLIYVASQVVTEAGTDRVFPAQFNVGSGHFVVYAYGVKDNNVNSTIKYENYVAAAGEDVATLDVIQLFRTSDYGLTMTCAVAFTAH